MKTASAEKWRVSPDDRPGASATPKARIVGELGEQELLLPAPVSEALAANDRAKYLMTLLLVAREHADHPDEAATDLKQERLACGVADAELDTVAGRSRKDGSDVYVIPAALRFHDLLVEAVHRMLAPLRAKDGLSTSYEERLRSHLTKAPSLAEDRISGAYINRLTSGQRDGGIVCICWSWTYTRNSTGSSSNWPPRPSTAPVSTACAKTTVR
jgi:hypothetical protein